jgi:large subunit ribosomal protein L9
VSTNVKVLLQSNVPNLGDGGEIVKVRAGFARNFLLPRGLAVPATAGNLKRVDELKRAASAVATKEREGASDLAAKLASMGPVVIERAFGEEGKMYGSVTAKDIEEAYERRGVTIDRKRIQLADPIKQLGTVALPIKLHAEVTGTLSVEVKKKGT